MSHVSVAKALSHKMPTPAILQPMEKWAETENNLYKKSSAVNSPKRKNKKHSKLGQMPTPLSGMLNSTRPNKQSLSPILRNSINAPCDLRKKSADTLMKLKSYTRMLYSDSTPLIHKTNKAVASTATAFLVLTCKTNPLALHESAFLQCKSLQNKSNPTPVLFYSYLSLPNS